MKRISFIILFSSTLLLYFILSGNSCGAQKKSDELDASLSYSQLSPHFNSDSAYIYIENQLAFGPRVPATQEHQNCGDYLCDKLREFGAQVYEQTAEVVHYDGKIYPIRNIIGSYHPHLPDRVLLCAHWDTRPFADQEKDPSIQLKPILGADDGASGVAVLLEIARQLQLTDPPIGVDIIFFDMEDWGQPEFDKQIIQGDWWCVGSRYWSEQPHTQNYNAKYGILLDMVGGANATFLREGNSWLKATELVNKVWSTASDLNYAHFFRQQNGGYITDDHLPIMENLKIPCIDIINIKKNNNVFPEYWHTMKDDIRNIDKKTLHAVGQTVLEVIYKEKIKNH